MKYNKKLQEKILLEKVKAQDPDGFSELYNQYADKIYRYIYFKVSTREEAEDLTSEVFLKTWQYILLDKREIKYLNALLYQIARNLVIDFYRRRRQTEILNDGEMLENIEDGYQESLLKKIDIQTDIIRIEKSVRGLKDEYKDVIMLRYIEELSIKEISSVLNKSRGAVRVIIHRALNILRKNIENSNEK